MGYASPHLHTCSSRAACGVGDRQIPVYVSDSVCVCLDVYYALYLE